MRRTTFAAAVAAFLLGAAALPPPALASDHFDFHRKQCMNTGLALDALIRSCTRVAQSDKFTKEAKGIAYYNIGVAYGRDGKLEKAAANFDKALGLNPKDRDAAFNRDLARRMLEAPKEKTGEKPQDKPQAKFRGGKQIERTGLAEDHRRNATGAPATQTKAVRTRQDDRTKKTREKAKRTKADPKKIR